MGLIIIGITGKRGAGKDTTAEYLKRRYGFSVLSFTRHVLSPMLRRRKKDITRENLISLALELRRKHGNTILAKKIDELIRGRGLWAIPGMRYPEEYYYFKEKYGEQFKLIVVECDTKLRYHRIKLRGDKGEATLTFAEFIRLDNAETEKIIDNMIELADISIDNNGTFEDLYRRIDRMMERHFGMKPKK